MAENSSLEEKVVRCGAVGGYIGRAAGCAVAAWAGYLFGNEICETFNVGDSTERGLIDAITIGVFAVPLWNIGKYVGFVAGGVTGAIYHPISKLYNKIQDSRNNSNQD